MKTIWETIEEKTSEYVSIYLSISPKYVLLDTKSFNALSKEFEARMRPDHKNDNKIVRVILNSYPYGLDILEVNTDKLLIKVVG